MAPGSRIRGSMGYPLQDMAKKKSDPSSDGSRRLSNIWSGLGLPGAHSATATGNSTGDIWRSNSGASDNKMIINQSTTIDVQYSEVDEAHRV